MCVLWSIANAFPNTQCTSEKFTGCHSDLIKAQYVFVHALAYLMLYTSTALVYTWVWVCSCVQNFRFSNCANGLLLGDRIHMRIQVYYRRLFNINKCELSTNVFIRFLSFSFSYLLIQHEFVWSLKQVKRPTEVLVLPKSS